MSTETDDLRRLRPLYNVPEQELAALLPLTRQRLYEEGRIVFNPGDPCAFALLVVSGRLEVEMQAENEWRTVGQIWPGELAGEAALFGDGRSHSVRVRAGIDTRALEITQQTTELARGSQAIAAMQRHLMAVMAKRIRSTNFAIRKAWQEKRKAQQPAAAPAPAGSKTAPISLGKFLKDLFTMDL